MIRPSQIPRPACLLLGLILALPGHAGSVLDDFGTNAPLPHPAPPTNSPPPVVPPSPMIPLDPVAEAVQDAKRLASEGELDEAMQKASSILQSHPQTLDALILRGNIYVDQKKWDLAEKDYAAALQIDGTNFTVKLNSAEIKFRQKNYDGARADFATLENDPDFGDLATYKVFLCDLFGGHEVAAKKELDAFNLAGTNPSYYFGNLAWALVHKNDVDARDWLASIDHIFTPRKILLYGSSLKDLGYLPLPKPTDS